MAPHFGSRVSGDEAYDKAVREEKGGGNVFGSRVVDSIKGDGPMAVAKRATEHGPRVVIDATQTDASGAEGEVAIDDLRNMLAENPTTLDSLYEHELARADGPRPDALGIFREVERGIKGAGRAEILNEIAELLGERRVTAGQRADLNRALREQDERMQERTAENALLDDAPRLKALREREDNLKEVQKATHEGTLSQLPLDTRAQAEQIAKEEGLDVPGSSGASEGEVPQTPAKPEGNVRVETQAPVEGASKGTAATKAKTAPKGASKK
jgi:hypothetical protein